MSRRIDTAAMMLFAGGISRHHYTPSPAPAVAQPGPPVDTRPRVEYRLPDETTIRVILDHGQIPSRAITYQRDGKAQP